MKSLTIEGKKFISSKQAAEIMGYTQDYIGQLARSGKISAQRVGGVWYIDESELSGQSSNISKENIKKGKFIDNLFYKNKNDIVSEIDVKNLLDANKSKKENITFEGVDYISSKQAAEIMGYTQDYIGQLARSGKISARQIGRGWYIPRSVVDKKTTENKNNPITSFQVNEQEEIVETLTINKEVNNANISTKSKEQQSIVAISKPKTPQKEVFNDMVTFHDNKDSRGVEKELHGSTKIHINKREQPLISKRNKDDYYYPSFLSASYSLDDTPLVPTPMRSREPVLHKIVTGERNEVEKHIKERQLNREDNSLYSKKVIKDTLKPKRQSLMQKSPMSLIKIASLATTVVVVASIVTFIPHTSVFSSSTSTLKTVFLFKTPDSGSTLKAEVTQSIPDSLMERMIGVFSSFTEEKIEYNSK